MDGEGRLLPSNNFILQLLITVSNFNKAVFYCTCSAVNGGRCADRQGPENSVNQQRPENSVHLFVKSILFDHFQQVNQSWFRERKNKSKGGGRGGKKSRDNVSLKNPKNYLRGYQFLCETLQYSYLRKHSQSILGV